MTYLSWGVIIVANMFGIAGFDTPFGMLLFIIGTWSPTVFSYLCLKKNGTICGIKNFVKIAFSYKQKLIHYFMIFAFLLLLYIPSAIITGTKVDTAWYLVFPIFPLMIIDGGLEELGWRYLLQPTLEKRFPYIIASTITAGIWLIWHLPLFFIAGSGQSKMTFSLFAIFIYGGSFALSAIFRISNSVWLCIVFHAMINTLSIYWSVAQNLTATLIASVCMVALSIAVVIYQKRTIRIK
jgi:membrane protease YdiL (CAAX protease family)